MHCGVFKLSFLLDLLYLESVFLSVTYLAGDSQSHLVVKSQLGFF